MFRFKLRTLLVMLAVGPPAIGFSALMAADQRPFVAVLILLWSVAFFSSVTSPSWTRARRGLTVADWLVIAAIAACAVELCSPSSPHYYWGYRE